MPPGVPFLRELALTLLKAVAGTPHPGIALSKVTLFLPTERAIKDFTACLMDEHHKAHKDRAKSLCTTLLPQCFTLGHLAPAAYALMQEKVPPALQKAQIITPSQRLGLLLQLIGQTNTQNIPMAVALRLAHALSNLLDRAAIEEVSLSALETLVPEHFSKHWQESLRFLEIVTKAWPSLLAEKNLIEPYVFEQNCANALSDFFTLAPPHTPVIIAGSTGTAPRIARLMKAVLSYAAGTVVLPSFDLQTSVPPEGLPKGHAQAQLHHLLQDLACNVSNVKQWPQRGGQQSDAQQHLLRQAFEEARLKEQNSTTESLHKADHALHLIEADTQAHEALCIALCLRQMLEDPHKTATIVVADPDLGKLIQTQMQRFGVSLTSAAGKLLTTHPLARFLTLLLNCVTQPDDLSLWLDLLKHPLTGCFVTPLRPLSSRLKDKLISHVESLVLRAQTPLKAPGQPITLKTLLRQINQTPFQKRFRLALRLFLPALRPLLSLQNNFKQKDRYDETPKDQDKKHCLETLCEALRTSAALLSGLKLDTKSLVALDAQLKTINLNVTPDAFCLVLRTLDKSIEDKNFLPFMSLEDLSDFLHHQWRLQTYGATPKSARVTLLGTRDLRLCESDVMFLAGLNEGSWPATPQENPWLSRSMRAHLGLDDEERLQTLAAHDFYEGASRPFVILSRSKRVMGADTTPSRFLQRLDHTLNKQGLAFKKLPHTLWANALDKPLAIKPCTPPAPKPPSWARARTFSPTSFELLRRNPYGFYARSILKLHKEEPLGGRQGPAFLGTLMHATIEAFANRIAWLQTGKPFATPYAPQAALDDLPELKRLFLTIAHDFFAPFQHNAALGLFGWQRLLTLADPLVALFAEAMHHNHQLYHEILGSYTFDTGEGPIKLHARADRIDLTPTGAWLIDYKTGVLPTEKDVNEGFSPQLPLYGLLWTEGGFTHSLPFTSSHVPLAGLAFWQLGLKGVVQKQLSNPAHLATQALDLFLQTATVFLKEDTPFLAEPIPSKTPAYNDYAHLARTAEWRRA
ncbi:MAG: double-strand break repair protein AddB [Holosporaceae bacterium]